MTAEPFCSICVDGTEDLQPNEEGKLECRPCREEHPRYGRYNFSCSQDAQNSRGPNSLRGRQARPRGMKF